MEIKVVPLGHIQTNCYMIETEQAAVVIDPGFNSEITEEFLKQNSKKERAILLTHCHFDHIGGASALKKTTDTPIFTGENETENLVSPEINLSLRFHAKFDEVQVDKTLKDGEILKVGDLEFKTIFTPGHTTGGVAYLLGDILFSGDTLFLESIGRTDFPGGDFAVLENSIKKLYTLPEETAVLPGHGEQSSIGYEKKFNPYVRDI